MKKLSTPKKNATSKFNHSDSKNKHRTDKKFAPKKDGSRKAEKGSSTVQKTAGKSSNSLIRSMNQKIQLVMDDSIADFRRRLMEVFPPMMNSYTPVPKYSFNLPRNVIRKKLDQHFKIGKMCSDSYNSLNSKRTYSMFKDIPSTQGPIKYSSASHRSTVAKTSNRRNYTTKFTSFKNENPQYERKKSRTGFSPELHTIKEKPRTVPKTSSVKRRRTSVIRVDNLSTPVLAPTRTPFPSLASLNAGDNLDILKMRKNYDAHAKTRSASSFYKSSDRQSQCNFRRPISAPYCCNSRSSKVRVTQNTQIHKVKNKKANSSCNVEKPAKEKIDVPKSKLESPKKLYHPQKNNKLIIGDKLHPEINIEYLNKIKPVRLQSKTKEKLNPQLIGTLPSHNMSRNAFKVDRKNSQQTTRTITEAKTKENNKKKRISKDINDRSKKFFSEFSKKEGLEALMRMYKSFMSGNSLGTNDIIVEENNENDATEENLYKEKQSSYKTEKTGAYPKGQIDDMSPKLEKKEDVSIAKEDEEIRKEKKIKKKQKISAGSSCRKELNSERECEKLNDDCPISDRKDIEVNQREVEESREDKRKEALRLARRGHFTMAGEGSILAYQSRNLQLFGEEKESSPLSSNSPQEKEGAIEDNPRRRVHNNVEEQKEISETSDKVFQSGNESERNIRKTCAPDLAEDDRMKFFDESNVGSSHAHDVKQPFHDTERTGELVIAKIMNRQEILCDIDEDIKALNEAMEKMRRRKSDAKSEELFNRLIEKFKSGWKSCPMINRKNSNCSSKASVTSHSEEMLTPSNSLHENVNDCERISDIEEEDDTNDFQYASSEITDAVATTSKEMKEFEMKKPEGGYCDHCHEFVDAISETRGRAAESITELISRIPEETYQQKLNIFAELSSQNNSSWSKSTYEVFTYRKKSSSTKCYYRAQSFESDLSREEFPKNENERISLEKFRKSRRRNKKNEEVVRMLNTLFGNVLQKTKELGLHSLALCVINSVRRNYPPSEGAHIALRTIRRFLERYGASLDTLILVVDNTDLGIYEVLLPLYFPRSKMEEEASRWQLPSNLGGQDGEPLLPDRQIRIIDNPQHTLHPDEESSDVPSRLETSITIEHGFRQMQGDLDQQRLLGERPFDDPLADIMVKEIQHQERYERLLRRAKMEDLTEVSGIGCLYQSGVDRLGRPVVVFVGKWFPFNKINLDKALLYLITLLDPIVKGDYVIAYFHTLTSSNNYPSFSWLKEVYNVLPYKYKKNLKAFYVVHPTFWTKMMTWWFTTFMAPAIKQKVHSLPGVEYLYAVMSPDQLEIPAFITEYDMTINGLRYFQPCLTT